MTKFEATDYDAIADDYAPLADEMPGNKLYERPAMLRLLPALDGLDVLDAGCGAGFYSDYASAKGARVVGFDPSIKMVDHARRRLGDRVELYHCTTDRLPALLGGRRFDLIISALVLHYVQDLNREMQLLASLLKRGGRVVISMRHPFVHGDGGKGPHSYRKTGWIKIDWEMGKMTFIQRPLWRIMEAFRGAGLLIERIDEPEPHSDLKGVDPALWTRTIKRPFFIMFVLRTA